MRLVENRPFFTIKGFDHINNYEDIADILMCFLEGNNMVIFGCVDIEYFLDNLSTEDDSIKNFYNKLIEFNKKNYGEGILREDEEEKENALFIKERTVFVNNGEDFPLQSDKKRRMIWYKASEKNEIVKALKINNLFKCIILKENSAFSDFQYALEHYESEDGTELIIIEKQDESFITNIYPKIVKIIGEISK